MSKTALFAILVKFKPPPEPTSKMLRKLARLFDDEQPILILGPGGDYQRKWYREDLT